jgi:hypothetical protein
MSVMARKTAYLLILSPLALAWSSVASGQEVATGQDVTTSAPVAVSYAGDMADDAKAPMPPAPPAPMPGAEAKSSEAATMPEGAKSADTAANGSSSNCSSSGSSDCCKLTCPDQTTARLFGDCCRLKCHDVTIQGWVEGGYAWHDAQRNPDGFNGPDGFNDRDEELQLNQFYTTIQKALKDNDCAWDWGYTVDLLMGTDYRYPLSKGLDADDNGIPKWNFDTRNFYGLAMPQAYLEFGTKCLSYKVGHWYTLLGYEVVPSPANIFYSHSYAFLYGIPFTHTGVLATYKANDQLTMVFGVDEGWDNFDDTDENLGYTGEVVLTTKDKHTTLTYAWQWSNEPIISGGNPTADPAARQGRFVNSIYLTHDLNDRLSYVVENIDGFQENGEPGGGTSSWYSIDTYLVYKLNCCWTAASRLEWFRDTDGTRVAPVGDFQVPNGNVASVGGFAGNFYDITVGLNYHPNGNVQVRPEIRYDWFSGQDLNGVKPYHDGMSNHQWIYSVDTIVQF